MSGQLSLEDTHTQAHSHTETDYTIFASGIFIFLFLVRRHRVPLYLFLRISFLRGVRNTHTHTHVLCVCAEIRFYQGIEPTLHRLGGDGGGSGPLRFDCSCRFAFVEDRGSDRGIYLRRFLVIYSFWLLSLLRWKKPQLAAATLQSLASLLFLIVDFCGIPFALGIRHGNCARELDCGKWAKICPFYESCDLGGI